MSTIIDFFKHVYEYCLALFSSALSWINDILLTSINTLLNTLVDGVPDLSSYWDSLRVIQPYFAFINLYFPLQEASIFIGFYFVFIGSFLTVKYTVKLFIPTVG